MSKFLLHDVSISRSDKEELKLAVLTLYEELSSKACLLYEASEDELKYYNDLMEELSAMEGLLEIKEAIRLVWRSPKDYEWRSTKNGTVDDSARS